MAVKRKFYVYILSRPTGQPFYVGKGIGRRIYFHEMEAKYSAFRNHKLNIIRKIWRDGGCVGRWIDSWHEHEVQALEREKELITSIGRHELKMGPLSNQTDGGDGVVGLTAEIVRRMQQRSAATRRTDAVRRMNAARQRQWHKDHPAESRQSVQRASEGGKNFRRKFPLLEVGRVERSLRSKRRDSARQRTSEWAKRWHQENPEMSSANVACMWTPEAVARRNLRAAAACRRPEVKAHNLASLKRWREEHPEKDQQRIDKLRAYAKSAENRRRVSEQMKARHARAKNGSYQGVLL